MLSKIDQFPLSKLPKGVFQKCSEIWDVPFILLLCKVCREFNHQMSHNSVWKFRAKKEIPEYKLLHPTEIKRMQKERFWKGWYLDRILRAIRISPPKTMPRPPTEWDNGGDPVFVLAKGSICTSRTKNKKTGEVTDVFWVCVGHELSKTMFPSKYRLCRLKQQEVNEIFDGKVVHYKKSDMVITGCKPHGGTALDHTIFAPDMY